MSTTVVEEPQYAPAPLQRGNGGTREVQQQGAVSAPSTEEVTTRFLQFLIPAAATVASTFGPQIGSAVGGLFGGSAGAQSGSQIGSAVGGLLGNLGGGINLGGLFGGRSLLPVELGDLVSDGGGFAQPALDLTTPLVQQCTLECLGKITPELATVLQNWYPQMQSASDGSRSAEEEIKALERFWPELSSWVTQQVASNLPDIMKTVTSSVMPLLGARETAQITPLLTGTEAHARWFLPVLNSVLTAVQQNLGNLLNVLDGSRASRDTGITWTDLAVYGRFWDSDFIRVVGQEDLSDQGSVKLVLELAPHLSWAKEIQIRDDNGAVITRLQVHDATKWAEATVPADQILTNGSLLFAKAKMFGIMTGMYVLSTAGLNELRGKTTHIRWMSD
jgi:hypothetical protein